MQEASPHPLLSPLSKTEPVIIFFLLADDRTDVRHMRAMFCKLVRLTMITVVCAVLGAGDVYRNYIVMETRIIIT